MKWVKNRCINRTPTLELMIFSLPFIDCHHSMNSSNFTQPKCFISFSPAVISQPNIKAFTIIYASLIPFVICSNLLQIIGIIKTKRNKFTSSQILFLILSASDLTLGTIQLPLQISLLQIVGRITCLQSQVRVFWLALPICLSGNIILLISTDRYLLIVKNTLYKYIVNNRNLIIAIVSAIILALIWAIWYAILSNTMNLSLAAVYFISLSLYELIVLLTALFLNVSIVHKVKEIFQRSSIKRRTDRNLTNTIVLITTTLIVTYSPSIICFSIAAYIFWASKDPHAIGNVSFALIWAMIPAQLNSVLNATIYISRNKTIKMYYQRLILKGTAEEREGLNKKPKYEAIS